jgi:DNA adenine methylase
MSSKAVKTEVTKRKKPVVAPTTEVKTTAIIKPPLKWVGGKTQIMDEVIALFPREMENYYEPFLGGGSVLLALLSYQKDKQITIKDSIVASDINSNTIGLYKNIQTNVEEFIDKLRALVTTYSEITGTEVNRKAQTEEEAKTSKESYYYWIRKRFNSLTKEQRSQVYGSVLLLFLNKTCFRGVYREGPNGFNVPFEKQHQNQGIFDEEQIREVSKLIQNVTFVVQGFGDALKNVKKGDFVYLDPPYAPINATSFVGYTADGFKGEDHALLFELCNQLTNSGAKLLMSNADVPLVKDAFPSTKYQTKIITTRRAINSKNPEEKTNEVLITN